MLGARDGVEHRGIRRITVEQGFKAVARQQGAAKQL
jgi:hypothetical protein